MVGCVLPYARLLCLHLALLFCADKLVFADKPLVVCTTTHLALIAKALLKDNADVECIIPYGMCPGHYELKFSDMQKLSKSTLILEHGFEAFLKNKKNLQNKPIIKIDVQGNWLIPNIHQQAAERICDVLCKYLTNEAPCIKRNLSNHLNYVTQQVPDIRARCQNFKDVPVICSIMNAELMEWIGLKIVATFKRDEDVSALHILNVINAGKQNNVAVIIDNQQSSGKVGETLAKEINVPLVMLSNFPEYPSTYPDLLYETIEKINNVLKTDLKK